MLLSFSYIFLITIRFRDLFSHRKYVQNYRKLTACSQNCAFSAIQFQLSFLRRKNYCGLLISRTECLDCLVRGPIRVDVTILGFRPWKSCAANPLRMENISSKNKPPTNTTPFLKYFAWWNYRRIEISPR